MKWQFLLIYLTLVGAVARLIIVEKQASYLAGRQSVFDDEAQVLKANCYAKTGKCNDGY